MHQCKYNSRLIPSYTRWYRVLWKHLHSHCEKVSAYTSPVWEKEIGGKIFWAVFDARILFQLVPSSDISGWLAPKQLPRISIVLLFARLAFVSRRLYSPWVGGFPIFPKSGHRPLSYSGDEIWIKSGKRSITIVRLYKRIAIPIGGSARSVLLVIKF